METGKDGGIEMQGYRDNCPALHHPPPRPPPRQNEENNKTSGNITEQTESQTKLNFYLSGKWSELVIGV